jgi:hypothetical protein
VSLRQQVPFQLAHRDPCARCVGKSWLPIPGASGPALIPFHATSLGPGAGRPNGGWGLQNGVTPSRSASTPGTPNWARTTRTWPRCCCWIRAHRHSRPGTVPDAPHWRGRDGRPRWRAQSSPGESTSSPQSPPPKSSEMVLASGRASSNSRIRPCRRSSTRIRFSGDTATAVRRPISPGPSAQVTHPESAHSQQRQL